MPTFKPVNEVADAKKARKERQAFYTPLPLVEKLVEWAKVHPYVRALEPSAGDGRIVAALQEQGVTNIDVCEIDETMQDRLQEMGANLVGTDFIRYTPEEPYTRIVMNPPFSGGAADAHIQRAWSMLAPGGVLIAVAPPRTMERLNACELVLPDCSFVECEMLDKGWFKEFGTNIPVCIVHLERDDAAGYEGYANFATANAAISIQTDGRYYAKRLKKYDGAKASGAFRADLGFRAYGVNWDEVAQHLNETWGAT